MTVHNGVLFSTPILVASHAHTHTQKSTYLITRTTAIIVTTDMVVVVYIVE